MSVKLSDVLKHADETSSVDSNVSEYEEQFQSVERGKSDDEEGQHETVNNLYYDLVTDFLSMAGADRFTLPRAFPARVSRPRWRATSTTWRTPLG